MIDLNSNHALSQIGWNRAEVDALISALKSAPKCRSDDHLLEWKRGRGGEGTFNTYRKAEKWLQVARRIVSESWP